VVPRLALAAAQRRAGGEPVPGRGRPDDADVGIVRGLRARQRGGGHEHR